MKLSAFSACVVDYYPQINQYHLGGNSLNVASMWKSIVPHEEVSVITCLGSDSFGTRIRDFLIKKGIDIHHVYIKEGMTANNQLRVDETGERFGIEGTWRGGLYETFRLSPDDWEFVLKQDLIAVPGNNPNFSEMVKRKKAGQFLAVDYLDIENKLPVEETLLATDIAFITARPHLLNYYKQLADKTQKLIVVTLGAEGSRAYYLGSEWVQPAIHVPRVIDTTGCGDAYQAAFALSYLQHRDIAGAMQEGAKAAAEIIQYYGGVGREM